MGAREIVLAIAVAVISIAALLSQSSGIFSEVRESKEETVKQSISSTCVEYYTANAGGIPVIDEEDELSPSREELSYEVDAWFSRLEREGVSTHFLSNLEEIDFTELKKVNSFRVSSFQIDGRYFLDSSTFKVYKLGDISTLVSDYESSSVVITNLREIKLEDYKGLKMDHVYCSVKTPKGVLYAGEGSMTLALVKEDRVVDLSNKVKSHWDNSIIIYMTYDRDVLSLIEKNRTDNSLKFREVSIPW